MLTEIYGAEPFLQFYQPTFFDEPARPAKKRGKLCRVYNDGGHFVAVPLIKACSKRNTYRIRKKDPAREIFDGLYAYALIEGKNRAETLAFLQDNLCPFFDDEAALNAFIDGNLKRKANNLHNRKKRFHRKANLNRWTHFITITYSDEKCTEIEFRAKLRRCLSNLHTRRGWRYLGVFEYSPEKKRLHFHMLAYIPDGQMLGTISEVQDYSTKSHKMQTTYSNSFFEKRFGRNDFKALDSAELKHGNAIGYLLKYIEKTGERISYSRGIPAEIYTQIANDDVCAEIRNFVLKYVLFDDTLTWERDIQNYSAPPLRGYEPHYIC